MGGIAAILKEVPEQMRPRPHHKDLDRNARDMVKNAPAPDGNVIRPVSNPYSKTGGLHILFGNIAPKGSIVKTAGVAADMMQFEGPR